LEQAKVFWSAEEKQANNQIAATGLEWKFEDAFSDASARGIYKSKNKFPSKKVRERESQVERRDKEPAAHHTQLKCKLLGGEKEMEKWMGRRRRRRRC
jgi:polynucleotide 5'-kinase involved in rRNA processing